MYVLIEKLQLINQSVFLTYLNIVFYSVISILDAESVFHQVEAIRILGAQVSPKVSEPRYGILGLTSDLLHVFVCFTIRGSEVRIINIRKMNKKERKLYAQLCKK